MPHATMKLIPGIDTNKTPALNEAAFSQSQLIRFVPDRNGMGLVQKLGGWVDWGTGSSATTQRVIDNITDLHAWEDLNGVSRLSVGATGEFSYIVDDAAKNYYVITPETAQNDLPVTAPISQTVSSFNTGTSRITTPIVWGDNVPVYFTSTGTLPTGITSGTVYYTINSTGSNFQISATISGATPVTLSGVPTGTATMFVAPFSVVNGSSIVTVADTTLNVQSVTFSNSGAPQTATIDINNSTISTATIPANDTIVTFTTSGSLPTGISIDTLYYVVNATVTTYQISTAQNGTAITFSGTQAGTQTATVPTIVTVSSNAPLTGTNVSFLGGSLPTGVTAGGAGYYAYRLSSTSFILTTTFAAPYTYVTTTSSGSGTIYTPYQIRRNFDVNLQTPISIANLYLSGVYRVTNEYSNSFFSVYQFNCGVSATSSSKNALLPQFSTGSGTSDVTVYQPNHPYVNGSTASFLYPTTQNGVSIYGNYDVALDPTTPTTTYNIVVGSPATATGSFYMNGGSAHVVYYYNIPSLYASGGYGSGGYGSGGYGIGAPISYPTAPTITSTRTISDWTTANFGEILAINPQGYEIYYWSPTQNTATAQLLETAPLANQGIFIAMPSRQIVAYGSTSTGIQDPLLIRWSDAQDATVWIASGNNLAGSYRIPEGSKIVGGTQGPQQAIIWTDVAVWAMQFVGYPNAFGFNKLADGFGLIGKKAYGQLGNNVYWMSQDKFAVLSGTGAQPIACPVWDQVFQNINVNATDLIRCATNSVFGEVTWYYPSFDGVVNDSYVKYNIYTQQWDYGILGRTAWIDQSVIGNPVGSGTDGVIYQHEEGYNDDVTPMVSSFQTGFMQLNEADNLIMIDQIWPDFKWQTNAQSESGSPTSATVYMSFIGANYPDGPTTIYGPYEMNSSTQYLSVRIRNRLLAIKFDTADAQGNAALDTFFRIGAIRYRYQMDGRF